MIMRIYFCHSKEFDYQRNLYTPVRKSLLNMEHNIFLPHEDLQKTIKSKDIIRDCDIVFAEVSFPATGMGIEIGWADAFGVPIVCLYGKNAQVSKSLRFITNDFIEYDNSEDLVHKITLFLKKKEISN
jgi:hypothetical protein